MKQKGFLVFVSFFLAFLLLVPPAVARADDLVIRDDGMVILFVTNNGVLGESTKEEPKKEEQKSQPRPPAPEPPKTAVPLVPAHTESTIQVSPPINNDKKVQVTITAGTPAPTATSPNTQAPNTPKAQAPTSQTSTQTTVPTPPSVVAPSAVPQKPINKTVDQVVAQGANGQAVITIKSDQANQLTIQQGTTQVTTPLPIQINSLTHSLSVPSENESARVSVLPQEAVQGAVNKGSLNAASLPQAKINLTQDQTGINYVINSEKSGTLFGVLPVKSPVQVKVSAQNGKVVKTTQSPIFNLFGIFIK